MDDGAEGIVRARKTNPHTSIPINPIILRLSMSLITMVFLLWAMHCGFRLATLHPTRLVKHTNWAFCVGVVTMLLGFMFLLLGLAILLDLVLNLSHQLQEDAGVHKAWETRKLSKAIAGIIAIVITLIILWWGIYMGFRLATEPGNKAYILLTTSIGMLTVMFGSIYFIIGVNIIAKLGLDLFDQLQQKKKKGPLYLSRLKQ